MGGKESVRYEAEEKQRLNNRSAGGHLKNNTEKTSRGSQRQKRAR